MCMCVNMNTYKSVVFYMIKWNLTSGSSPVCGVVGPWSLLWVDPGLNGTKCCSLQINQFLRSIYPLDKNILISRIFLFLRYTLN